jgi:hypothetical protein
MPGQPIAGILDTRLPLDLAFEQVATLGRYCEQRCKEDERPVEVGSDDPCGSERGGSCYAAP